MTNTLNTTPTLKVRYITNIMYYIVKHTIYITLHFPEET